MSDALARSPSSGPFTATLWAVRSPAAIVCFRVQVDPSGRVVASSVPDFGGLAGELDFDAQLRAALRARYGAETEILIAVDGGAGAARFLADVRAGRDPSPPRSGDATAPAERRHAPHQQQALWDR